jgi:hypothetical protein
VVCVACIDFNYKVSIKYMKFTSRMFLLDPEDLGSSSLDLVLFQSEKGLIVQCDGPMHLVQYCVVRCPFYLSVKVCFTFFRKAVLLIT